MPFKRQKSNVSPHYHDTRTLLRKYRDVMWNLEVSDLDLQEEFKAEYGPRTHCLLTARSTRAATGWKAMPAPWNAAKK